MMKSNIMRAIKAEVSYNELEALYRQLMENGFDEDGDFYFPDIYINVCMMRMRDEIDDEYFRTWLIILCNLLNGDENHIDLADIFDGASFNEGYDALNCRWIISMIKNYDNYYRNNDIVKFHKCKKMKVIYLRFEYCTGENDAIYKCYIIDHGKQTYDVRMIWGSELDYDLSKNYCYIYDQEHEADIKRQKEDDSLDCIDCSKLEKQFCEIEEELIMLFYEKYKRDKSLEL